MNLRFARLLPTVWSHGHVGGLGCEFNFYEKKICTYAFTCLWITLIEGILHYFLFAFSIQQKLLVTDILSSLTYVCIKNIYFLLSMLPYYFLLSGRLSYKIALKKIKLWASSLSIFWFVCFYFKGNKHLLFVVTLLGSVHTHI